MLLKELSEAMFSKKQKANVRTPLTIEERELIARVFPETNAFDEIRKGEFTFDDGAHAAYKNLYMAFYKRDGELRVSVAHFNNIDDRANPKAPPALRTDHAVSEDELERIKGLAR